MEEKMLLVEEKGHIGTLIINRPAKRNSLTPDTLVEIYQVLQEWSKGNDIRVVIFRGAGDKAFCAGYDIGTIPTKVNPDLQERLKGGNIVEIAMEAVKDFPYPTIAMMNGYTFGAGFNLAMVCDIRIAVDDIRMGMPAAKLGVVYHPEGIKQYIHALGFSTAREVLFTAKTYKGPEAKEKGMVDYLVPQDWEQRLNE